MVSIRTALLASAITLVSAASASASSYSVSTTFGPTLTDFATNLSIAGYVAAGHGTLTGVSITLNGNASMSGPLTNTSGTTQTFTFSEDSKLNLSSAFGTPSNGFNGVVVDLIATQTSTLAGGASTAFGPYAPTASFTANPTDLADFIGGTLNFAAGTKTGFTVTGGGGNVSNAIVTNAGGTVTVTYTYDIPQVPEPASIALLGAGLVGLGLVRRKKA